VKLDAAALFALVPAALAVVLGAACAPAPATSRPEPPIASAWRARCGGCHMRVEPGSHTHAQLQAAANRHRVRTKLKDAEWTQLVDFLASDLPAEAARDRQDGTASIARR
jgi:hypothetical protein